jgi:hypothetical protein
MSEPWYRAAGAREPLTQGDLIFDCPALSWKPSAIEPPTGSVAAALSLGEHVIAEARDLVVMTQACDPEHAKVTNVVLCPHYGLDEFKSAWEDDQRSKGQYPTEGLAALLRRDLRGDDLEPQPPERPGRWGRRGGASRRGFP